jgi:hypothetical protein
MSPIHCHCERRKSGTPAGVSLRTLILMLELLVAVVALQYVRMAEPLQARAIWLAGDGHTAAMMSERTADAVAITLAPAPADEGAREP